MVHLIRFRKGIATVGIANPIWQNIVQLHDIPMVIYSDRGTQFTSQFLERVMEPNGADTEVSSSYHSLTKR